MANHTAEQHVVTEGGFLTGRNPFMFIAAAPLPTFIIQLLVIICMSRLVKLILSPIKQPSVVAEIISGILLGPTLMGHIPNFTSTIFPAASLPFLNLMSNFGLVLFLFLVGLELDPRMLRKSIKTSFAISLAGMALPFLLGCGTSYILYNYIEPESHRQKGFFSYLLFLGVAMAITAFPVLARILTELNLLKTKVGGITISAAAVDDATSWCLLALVISIINANSNMTAVYVFLMGLGYSLILILIVRPIFIWSLRRAGVFEQETPSQASMFFALMIVFVSAFITDAIGIHAIFGGFIAGIIMPHENGFAYHITEKLEDVVQILFLPLYFALSGLKTKIGTLDSPLGWGVVVLTVVAACSGKIIGCTLAARLTRLTWRESFAVGTLMNCKGLVELIVLNLGYDSGVISDETFAIMVIMALVTTFITVPIVSRVYPPKYQEHPEETLNGLKKTPEPSLLVSVNKIEQVGPLLSVVDLVQSQMNLVRRRQIEELRKSSNSSTQSQQVAPAPLKTKTSCTSVASLLNIIPGAGKSSGMKDRFGLTINVLRLIELTERDSSVMLSASEAALSNDPITKLLRAFCEMSNKANQVEGMVKVVTMEMFGKVLAQAGEQVNAKYILIPWSGAGAMIEDRPPRAINMVAAARRRQSIHTPTQHFNLIQDLLIEAKSTVLIFVDRCGPMEPPGIEQFAHLSETREVYLPFFGGKDDREALELVMGMGHVTNVRVNVIRYKSGIDESRRESEASTTDSTNGGPIETVRKFSVDVVPIQATIQMDNKDEELLQKYFGAGVGETIGEESEGVRFTQVVSTNPVGNAIQYLTKLSGSDLIVTGRENLKLLNDGGHLRNEDADRKKILGDFTEAVMTNQSCNASLLVVHSLEIKK